MKYFLMIYMVLLAVSCNKKEIYSKEDLYFLAKEADATTTFILPRSITEGAHCSDYPEGCLSAHMVQVQKLDFIAVEFATTDQAIYAAKKVRGFYTRNWLLDDVAGEPTLERFVIKSLEAKKP